VRPRSGGRTAAGRAGAGAGHGDGVLRHAGAEVSTLLPTELIARMDGVPREAAGWVVFFTVRSSKELGWFMASRLAAMCALRVLSRSQDRITPVGNQTTNTLVA
jgi:hypothetical protein